MPILATATGSFFAGRRASTDSRCGLGIQANLGITIQECGYTQRHPNNYIRSIQRIIKTLMLEPWSNQHKQHPNKAQRITKKLLCLIACPNEYPTGSTGLAQRW